MTRESIYAALFAYFSALTAGGSPAFKLATRNLKTWEDVAPEDQPALLMRQVTEAVERPRGLPPKWTLRVDLMLYVHTAGSIDPTVVPSQLLNPLLDAVEAALTVMDPATNTCTLGGLVYHASYDGAVELFEGSLGDQACAIIPISVVVPS